MAEYGYYEEEPAVTDIAEGHGLTDVSCVHGSRWIWWAGLDGEGAWNQVVLACTCDCADPPRPIKEAER
jgi:hypothetical protein